MVKIVIPDDYPPVISGTEPMQRLRTLGEVTVYETRPSSSSELVSRIGDAPITLNIRAYCKFTEEVLTQCRNLRMISVFGAGVDNVDLTTATRLGILVANTPNTSTEAVAEHALALMLAVARRLTTIDRQMREGRWERGLVTQLSGKTLGIIGTGAIGMQMARLGRGIGMKVQAWTLHPSNEKAETGGFTYVPLEELLRTSDVVSLHLRISEETRRLLDKDRLALMKPTAILINTARGGLVDQDALTEMLKTNRIAGAGLDVYEVEPLDPSSQLLKLENVVLTPHSAGQTREALDRGLNMAVDNIASFLRGSPRNVVNPEALQKALEKGPAQTQL
jgi:D-3-phosphoglycerate dehydrogenase